MISAIIQVATLILLLFFFEFFVVQAYNIVFRGYAPFLATKSVVLKRLLSELKINKDAVVYELGAGRAGLLRMLRKQYPNAKLTGVEYSFFPWLIGKFQNAITNSKIKLLKENIFKIGLKGADAVYCYLNVDTMIKLEEKFNNELREGAKVISYQFPLPTKKTERTIDLGEEGKIYFYQY